MRIINSTVEFLRESDRGALKRGFEQQTYTLHDDNTITLNVVSVALDHGVTRNVVLNLDHHWQPTDSYVRYQVGDRVEGYGWFRFEPNRVVADIVGRDGKHRREQASLGNGKLAFAAHPIATDLTIVAAFDRHAKQQVQHLTNIVLSSSHPFGATGPEIAPVELEVEYLGTESLSLLNQTFDTDHWRILSGNDRTGHNHPGEDLWALRDSLVFIHAEIDTLGYSYNLRSFNDTCL